MNFYFDIQKTIPGALLYLINLWHMHGHDASFQHTLNQTWIARSTDAKQSFKFFIFIVYVHNNMYLGLGAYEYGA